MTGALHKLARFCAGRHWWVIGAWIALTVVLVLASRIAGSLTSDDLTLAGTGSTKSVDLLEQRLPNEANGTNPIVLEATQGKLTDSANSAAVTDAVETLRQNPYVVRVVSPLDSEGKAALSKDETIGYISVTLNVSQADLDVDQADSVVNDADVAEKGGHQGLGRRLPRAGSLQAIHPRRARSSGSARRSSSFCSRSAAPWR